MMDPAWLISIMIVVVGAVFFFRDQIRGFFKKVKYVCSEQYDTKSSERVDVMLVFGSILTVLFTIVQAVAGFDFNGIFGFISKLIVWGIACNTLVYVLLCSGNAIRYARSIPKQNLLAVCLLLPAGVLISYLAGKLIGFPLLHVIMEAIDKTFFYFNKELQPVCERTAALCGFFVWFFVAKDGDEFRKWPMLLIAFAVLGIVGTFLPLGLGAVLAGILIALVFKVGFQYVLGKYATPNEAAAITSFAETKEEIEAQNTAMSNINNRVVHETPVTDEEIWKEESQ